MANAYYLPPLPLVTLPADLTWTENPYADDNWAFQLHSLWYALDLLATTDLTGDPAYAERALALLQDWSEDNPRVGAPSVWSWNDHSTALRAIVLACVADLVGMPAWLPAALLLHGETLADPTFYRGQGNHALNQAIGLLEVGRVLGRSDWIALAVARINALIQVSIDSEGVSNEGSVGYELYNLQRYAIARDRILAAGGTPAAAFARLTLMPKFLAMATLPIGQYEMIGDTKAGQATVIPGTWAEYAATRGAAGPKPSINIARYNAGYLFIHSGWGEHRAAADETFASVRWGQPAWQFHGHADGMQLTLAAFGSRLLVDPGLYAYGGGAWRTYFKQRSAHNVVTVDGLTWPMSAPTTLLGYIASSRFVDVRMQTKGYTGVTQTRRVTYLSRLGYYIVEDTMTSSTIHTYRQLWHLVENSNPAVGVSSVWTQRPRGNVLIRQLTGGPTLNIVKGRTSPIQGWISYEYGKKVAAPVEEAVQRAANARYVTFVLPAEGKPVAALSNFKLTSTGYTITVTIGGHSERLTVSGSSIWLTVLS